MKVKPLRWRQEKAGRHGAPKTRGLYRDGVRLATAQQNKDGMWFWYGQGCNTAGRPAILSAVELEASAYIRERGL